MNQPQFDVFLAHNNLDKPQVRAIANELKRRRIKPWLDEEQIRPGQIFQIEIQKAIRQVKSAVIFIGKQGLGKWQTIELPTLYGQFVKAANVTTIIPVLLPGVNEIPEDLLFLAQHHCVSFANGIGDEHALDLLAWGIREELPEIGIRPTPLEPTFFRRDFLKWATWSGLGLVTAVVSREIFLGDKSPTPNDFEFDVIKVNASGEGVKREKGKSQYFSEDVGNGVNLEMVYIPEGSFVMGTEGQEIERLVQKFKWDLYRQKKPWDRYRQEKPQHQVKVESFCMGKYAVTQEQWRRIAALPKVKDDLQADPSKFKGGKKPVEQVSWTEAVEFCARLSKYTNNQYRLPSEAEWEYACRAGTTTPFHFGEAITSELANYDGNYTYASEPKGEYRGETTQVGSFPPNGFGLYDMHGNVWEWCQDTWHKSYKGAPSNGSVWIDDNYYRLLRGGSWGSYPEYCRSAYRPFSLPDDHGDIGFRVVCVRR